MANHLMSALEVWEFVHTAELVMKRGHQVEEAEEFVRDTANEPHGICIVSATDLPGGSPALPPEPYVAPALELGLTPIVHLGKEYAHALLPPTDWSLDQTSSLSNRLTCNDNYPRRRRVEGSSQAGTEQPVGEAGRFSRLKAVALDRF